MTSDLRPAESMTSITSIAGLKKAIETYTQLYFPKGAEDYGKGLKDGSRIALEKISEFEAGVRERIGEYDDKQLIKTIKNAPPTDPAKLRAIAGVLEQLHLIQRELRRVLGEEAT